MSRLLISIIRGYQYLISPLLGANCRFHPTCSDYSCQAFHRYGVFRGGWLSIRRLLRCHPWHEGGHDPLP